MYLTVREICDEYKVTKVAVVTWIATGKLRSLKVGSRHRITAEEWKRFLEECNRPK